MRKNKKRKGRSPDWVVNWEATVGDHPVSAYDALPEILGLSVNPTVRCFWTTCSLPAGEAALSSGPALYVTSRRPGWDGF